VKVLVLGAGGMAGHIVVMRLAELGYDVMGFARRKLPFCNTIVGDAMESDIPSIMRGYDAVINCIGVLNNAVDAEPYKGIWLNSCLPHLLANHAKRVIHISTDCVFSGQDGGGYNEESFRSADTMYGRSKAIGELNNDRNLTIRTSIVGPDINENGIGLFNWFMKQTGTIRGYTNAIWGGVTSLVLADAINVTLKQELTGIIHLTNGQRISKYELLKLFAVLRDEPIEVVSCGLVKEDKSLISMREDLCFTVPDYKGMVCEMGKWVNKHKYLYPLYKTRDVFCNE